MDRFTLAGLLANTRTQKALRIAVKEYRPGISTWGVFDALQKGKSLDQVRTWQRSRCEANARTKSWRKTLVARGKDEPEKAHLCPSCRQPLEEDFRGSLTCQTPKCPRAEYWA